MRRLLAPLSLLAALSLSAPAFADSIVTRAFRMANDNAPTTNVFKALNDNGTTALPFKTAVNNDLVRVTFNAECGVLGPTESWVSVTILIDGVQPTPRVEPTSRSAPQRAQALTPGSAPSGRALCRFLSPGSITSRF